MVSGFDVQREQLWETRQQTQRFSVPGDNGTATIFVTTQSVTTPDGSTHDLGWWGDGKAGPGPVDGSGLGRHGIKDQLVSGNAILVDPSCPNPPIPSWNPVVSQDPNGNQIVTNALGWVDTLGRLIPGQAICPSPFSQMISDRGIYAGGDGKGNAVRMLPGASTTDFTGCPGNTTGARLWLLPAFGNSSSPSSTTAPMKLCYANFLISSDFGLTGVADVSSLSYTLLQNVILPDGTMWSFTYSNHGDLASISFPTGGSITYNWATFQFCTSKSRALTSRTVNDDTGSHTWNYAWTPGVWTNFNAPPPPTTIVVTDPAGNDSVHVSTSMGGCSYYETQAKYYQSSSTSGTLLKQIDTAYATFSNASHLYSHNSVVTGFPTTVTTTLGNGKVTQEQIAYDTPTAYTDWNLLCYNCADSPRGTPETLINGQVTSHSVFDYGSGGPGPLLRTTATSYHTLDDPSSIITSDALGNKCAETDYAYDDPNRLVTLNPPVTMMHGTPYPNAVRANLSSVTRWLTATPCSGSAAWSQIASYTNYNDTGTLASATDPLGNATSYTYAPTFYGAYTTQTQLPDTTSPTLAHHIVSGSYDFNTGLLTSFTNQNGQTSNYSYDSMWRLTSAQLPADTSNGGASAQTSFTYSAANVLPATVQRQASITNTLNDSLTVTFDGLGRAVSTQHAMPNGTATVNTVYDGLGRVASVTNPYFSTSDPTYGITQPAYDALGRATQVTEQDGSAKLVAYSQGACATGDDTTTTDEAGKPRRVCRDALGRLIEVDEPQASSLGTSATASVVISGALNNAGNGASPVAGSSLTSFIRSDGSSHTFFLDSNHHVIDLSLSGGAWHMQDLTAMSGGAAAAAGSALGTYGNYAVIYQGANQHVYQYWWSGSTWVNNDLTAASGTSVVPAAGTALTAFVGSGGIHVFYRGQDNHVYDLLWNGSAQLNQDLTALSAGAAAAAGSALATYGNYAVVYQGANQQSQHVYQYWWNSSNSTWVNNDMTAASGTSVVPATNTALTAFVDSSGIHEVYLGQDHHVYQFFWNGTLANQDLTALSGGNVAVSGSALSSVIQSSNGMPHIFFLDGNQHVDHMWFNSVWGSEDLTTAAGASNTAAAGGALTVLDGNNDALLKPFYLGANVHLYRMYWPTSGGFQNQDLSVASGVLDSGTVSLNVGSFTVAACYGNSTNAACAGQPVNSTSAQLASALAQAVNVAASPATASVSGSTISLTWKIPGSFTPAVSALSTNHDNSSLFPNPSFTSPATSFSGGTGPSFSGGYTTLYAYDALGNLLRVDQKGTAPADSSQWRTRLFTYDSLSRLLTAYNPEAGTIRYSYDVDGNLLQKTSPAPNQTGSATQTISYCYDALNRVTGRAYSAQSCPLSSPVVTYAYDGGANAIGHLTSLTDQAGSGGYSYDVLGRISGEQRTIAGISKGMSYSYNLDGSLKTLAYPSGATVTYTVDSAGRDVSAVDSGNAINYATGASYGPDSGLTGFVSGNSGSFAGISNSFSYNKRLQPINMSATSPSATVFWIGYDFHLGAGDNGNVWGITNNKDTTRNQAFTYDALNRLTSAQNAGTDCSQTTVNGKAKFWGNSYGYDAWGNLLQKTVTKCSAENLSVTALVNNQLSGYSYDAAGNMTDDATANLNYSYDQENRITSAAGYTYTYDGDGNRVEKSTGSTGTLYWYMSPGIVAESDLTGALKSEYVFFDGERVARKDLPGNALSYYFSDHLKTASVITDSAGNIKAESDYYPWGGELQFTNNDSNHYKFTGKERDSETGLDYFGARYYSNALARFVSADWSAKPETVPYAGFDNPQTLNLYRYPSNPETYADRDGHQSLESQR